MKVVIAALAGILALGTAASANGATPDAAASGAGATFPYPIYLEWLSAYKAATGITIDYQPVGSGLGLTFIRQRAVAFGASDMPLTPQMLDHEGLVQFPAVVGGDVPVVNLPGVRPGEMVPDGATLAGIYLGRIRNWADPALRRLNPGLDLPPLPISVVHRSDGSGTTFIWADYLSKQSAEWRRKVGANTLISWPDGTGARGNKGVAETVADVKGGIGYVEFSYALKHSLAYTRVLNRAGKAVSPSLDAFRAAAEQANWSASSQFYVLLNDLPGEKTWRIAGGTFILMARQPTDPAAARAALAFFKWAYEKGSALALQLNYVPLPPDAVREVEASWKAVRLARAAAPPVR